MISKLRLFQLSIVLFLFTSSVHATDYTVNSASQFNALNLQPCDVVTWTNGTYANQDIIFTGTGELGSPIVLRAETPGSVIFTGESKFNMYGDYLIVDGFYWNGGIGLNNHFELRRSGSSSDFASNSIVRNCAFNDLQPEDPIGEPDAKSRWIVMYGTTNTVENCSFLNKDTTGVCILVELSQAVSGAVNHTIRNNYFFNVTAKDGRLNDGDSEGMRIGSSNRQTINANVLVEENYFQEVDGENEIISNKSAGNIFRNNTFRNCRGSLVLRHGANALVESNYFLGENKAKSGGIRISDQDHVIINNYMQELDNTSDSFNNGITLMGGNAASGGTSNGYQNVSNVLIAFNTIYNSDDPIHFNDSRGSNVPSGTIANNLIYSENGNIVSGDIATIGGQMSYVGNIFGGSNIGISNPGITDANGDFSADGEIFKPSTIGPATNAATGTYNQVSMDIEGFTRPTTNKDVGAHEVVGATGTATNPVPIANASVGNGVGVCYLDATGMASASSCPAPNYGSSCAPISVTGVTVTPETASIANDGSQQLTATVTPNNATNQQVTWSSGDDAIATVDTNGLVNAVNPGTVTMTVTTVDGSFTDSASIEVSAPLTPPECLENTNLALNTSISEFSSQQDNAGNTNFASNVIDGDTDNRWSAETFPEYLVIDLGAVYNVNGINLYPFQNRAYQYTVEGSTTSSTYNSAAYSILVDRSANTTSSSVLSDNFTLTEVRYIYVNVTGASNYTGPWTSIHEIEVICAGLSLSVDDVQFENNIKLFPNPFNDEINIKIPQQQLQNITAVKLIDATGKVIQEEKITSNQTSLKLNETLSNGLYFLQVINTENAILKTVKMVKN